MRSTAAAPPDPPGAAPGAARLRTGRRAAARGEPGIGPGPAVPPHLVVLHGARSAAAAGPPRSRDRLEAGLSAPAANHRPSRGAVRPIRT